MQIRTKRFIVRRRDPAHAQALSAYYQRNAKHLKPWEPIRPDGFHSVEAWTERLASEASSTNPFLPLIAQTPHCTDVIGIVNLSNEVRGVFQACNLGFSVDSQLQGSSAAFEILSSVIEFAFDTLNLHRIMANHLPDNTRSARLLERLGFDKEGYAREYLLINGRWQDHVLTAKVNPDWKESRQPVA